jgi:tripartite-type tricarboxylate transporter receptor subunit TctC
MTYSQFKNGLLKRNLYAVLALLISVGAGAADYPSKPVRLIVPFGPGSGTDILARMIADELTLQTGGNFIIDNRAGASGIIGAEAVAKAAPDGYTLLVTSNTTHSGNPALFKKLPYDPIADFVPVARLLQWTAVLLCGPTVPATSMKELVSWAQTKKGAVNYAYSNAAGQLVAATLVQGSGMKDVGAIPYKSSPPAITDLVAGQVDFMVIDTASAIGLIKSGNVRALAILSESRNESLPGVPTFKESGFGNLNPPMFWGGVLAPANTPKPIVDQLNAALVKIVAKPAVSARMRSLGSEPWSSSVDEFDKFLREQLTVWKARVKAAGVEPQ